MVKNDGKKYHLKNDTVEHILLYHFLIDENHLQCKSIDYFYMSVTETISADVL